MTMRTSEDGRRLMHHYEGCKLKAYPDPATGGAPWTIGYGDTGPSVVPGLIITQAEADRRFANRLSREFEPGVLKALKHPVSQHQFDAMVSLAYNIGLANFRSSTLLKMVNAGDSIGAADQFLRWDKANKKSMLGLKRRRMAERSLFIGNPVAVALLDGAAVAA